MKFVYVLMVHFMQQTSTLDVLILPGKMDFAKVKFIAAIINKLYNFTVFCTY